MAKAHASDSREQRDAEQYARDTAAALLNCPLSARKVTLPGAASVDVDGFHAGPPATLVEVYARQGSLKGSQPKKLRAEAFKLVALRKLCFPDARLVLVVASEEAETTFYKGWTKEGLDALGIKVLRVKLDPTVVSALTGAQDRQKMQNAHKDDLEQSTVC